jgi:hypothetical protein
MYTLVDPVRQAWARISLSQERSTNSMALHPHSSSHLRRAKGGPLQPVLRKPVQFRCFERAGLISVAKFPCGFTVMGSPDDGNLFMCILADIPGMPGRRVPYRRPIRSLRKPLNFSLEPPQVCSKSPSSDECGTDQCRGYPCDNNVSSEIHAYLVSAR